MTSVRRRSVRALLQQVPIRVGYIIAINLLLASVLVAQVTGYLDRKDERSRFRQQVTELSNELDCRSRIGSDVALAQADLVVATGRGLVALVADDDAGLRLQARRVDAASAALEKAKRIRARAEDTCSTVN